MPYPLARKRRQLMRKTLLTVSLSMVFGPLAARADDMVCSSDAACIELDQGAVLDDKEGLAYRGDDGSHDGDRSGKNGARLELLDHGANFNLDPVVGGTALSNVPGAMYLISQGGDGHDEGDGGHGNTVRLESAGRVQMVVGDSNDGLGQVDAVLFAASVGGNGDGEKHDTDDDGGNNNNNTYGGDGGMGSRAEVRTYDTSEYRVAGEIRSHMYGIYATSEGGDGGDQNSSVFGDQYGGTGGDGGEVSITNRGSFYFSGAALAGSVGEKLTIHDGVQVAILRAESKGGDGGYGNGKAGDGGNVSVDHQAGLLSLDGATGDNVSIYGVRATSEGAEGYGSEDNSNQGGSGGDGGRVDVTVASDISIDVPVASGAIVQAVSEGGKGGEAPKKDHSGGEGGDAGNVTVTLAPGAAPYVLRTTADGMVGIQAQSKGGFGGDGEDSLALAGKPGGAGFGGDAGRVTVNVDSGASIETTGTHGTGVVAWSVGGGGGTGGDFYAILGGSGGKGGDGGLSGDVSVYNAGNIRTDGDWAFGIDAQSNAGGGGAGGISTGIIASVGGDGGVGGQAGTVVTSNAGDITTAGYGAIGISAQAIGGGGGNAGVSFGLVSVGGTPGEASGDANGGTVYMSNAGSIVTVGDAAPGMSGQSIGGGGGNASGNVGIITIGGVGEAAGDGGEVHIDGGESGSTGQLGTIWTQGDFSYGVIAQSIGGGGGNGGNNLNFGVTGSLGVGGAGDSGGDGGRINFSGTSPASITTSGENAHGILAQSIGGGGGAGGDILHEGFDFFSLLVGGRAGDGGDAGDIGFSWENLAVDTSGSAARGVTLQSIGGGGGTGGGIRTANFAIEGQLVIGVGGNGGDGGDGGKVEARIGNSSITTRGPGGETDGNKVSDSTAISLQSIGGGGGSGGSVTDHSLVIGIIFTEVGTAVSWDNLIMVGGHGGKGGDGGDIALDVWDSSVSTQGEFSNAILTQSIGGGGGDGGSAHAFSFDPVIGLESINIQAEAVVGGQCRDANETCVGGDGKDVSVNLGDWDGVGQTVVQTDGDYSNGVLAQSIGGGGGDGGSANAYSFDTETGVAFSVNSLISVGGKGGTGGEAGDVYVNTDDSVLIATHGSGARGIVAQSVGGGGGTGQGTDVYLSVDGQLSKELPGGVALDVGVGMSGGEGGKGAAVTVNNAGDIYTDGRDSDGVLVQSVGGGGGVGGTMGADDGDILDAVFNLYKAHQDSDIVVANGTLAVKVGGTGGKGGDGGASSLNQDGGVYTSGDYADGLVVQSIGGGGGIGGASIASTYENWLDVNISVGGQGGIGGQGGQAQVALGASADIGTQGYGAYGVLAQSIGGGGGQGGTGTLATKGRIIIGAGAGGGGGDGNNGSEVGFTSTSSNAIQTYGDTAHAVALQSIGGGGGAGGLTMGSGGTPFGASLVLTLSVGGMGGNGGDGGNVNACTGNDCAVVNILTGGDMATGLVAQSVGGGGGIGSMGDPDEENTHTLKLDLGLTLGGAGGDGGNGGAVAVQGDYNIVTGGAFSHGIAAQSIGGGGGMAAVTDPLGTLQPTYEEGQAGIGVRASLGSLADGAGGDGGAVYVSANGTLQTWGDGSHAMVAQSVGGGGGMAGSVINSDTPAPSDLLIERSLVLGADGSATGAPTGGTGGEVTLETGATIETYGRGSVGVIAQSVGGGGGIASVSQAVDPGQVRLGGGEGTWGDGGEVSVTLSGGEINTHGTGAHGVVAQSVGGGGGIGGDLGQALSVDGAAWAGNGAQVTGSGGKVGVSVQNRVFTNGNNAHGVVAQSIGGGGGLAGSAQGGFAGSVSAAMDNADNRASEVDVNVSGMVGASGDGSSGVFAQSEGASRQGGTVTVTVDGSVAGGSGNGAGVWISSNSTDRSSLVINSAGQVSALSGTAVRYDGEAGLAIQNSGLLSGSVYCSTAGTCDLANAPAGKMSAATVYQANVTNAGQLIVNPPADLSARLTAANDTPAGSFGRLIVAGNYTQVSSGVLVSSVDFANMRATSMTVQGNATLDGRVELSAVSLLPGRELTLLDVQGSSTGTLQASDTPIFDFDVRRVGQQQRVSVKGADFNAASQGLARNQRAVAGHLQDIWDRGGNAEMAPLFAVLNTASSYGAGTYRDQLEGLSPGVALAPAVQMMAGMSNFASSMMSCRDMERTGTDGREQDCFWGQVSRRSADQDEAEGTSGYSFDSNTYQVGGQHEFRPGWFIGGSMAYQNNSLRADNGRTGGSGDAGYAGVVLKHQDGPWVYAAAISGGYGSYDLDRTIGIDGYDREASSSPDVYSAGMRLRVSRHIGVSEQFYLKPYVDLDALYARMPSYTESGGPLSLHVDSSDQFVVGLSPMLEIGGRVDLPQGATMRPYAYAGASFLSDDSWDAQARFKGAPAGSDGFTTSLPGDNVIGRFGVGLQVNNQSGLDFRLQYDGEVSSKTTSHAGQLKVMYRF